MSQKLSRKLSRKLKQKKNNHSKDSSARAPIRAPAVQPGNIVWLPQSAFRKLQLIRQFECNHDGASADTDHILPLEAYDHPAVVLGNINSPSGHPNPDYYVFIAMLTSFGNTTGSGDISRLHARGATVWDSYLAIFPSTHPSSKDILYLQKGKLDKSSYVHLACICMPISVLKTYTRGPTARAVDIHLTSASLGVLLRELGIKVPQSRESWPGFGRAMAAIPPPPTLSALSTQARLLTPPSMPYRPQIMVPRNMLGESEFHGPSRRVATVMPSSPSLVSAPHSIPSRPPLSAREDILLITNTHRLSQPINLPNTRENYGSIETWSLPPPITWNPRDRRTSKISRIFNSISRDVAFTCLKFALFLFILGLIVLYIL